MTASEPSDIWDVRMTYGAQELVEYVCVRVFDGDKEITREVFGAEYGEKLP